MVLTVTDIQLQTISAVGAGLLIGTALGVILPEGSEAFRTAQSDEGRQTFECQSLEILHCIFKLLHGFILKQYITNQHFCKAGF